MHILRLYPTLPPYPGGAEQHVTRLSEWQRKLGATVMLVYNHGQSTTDDDIQVAKGIPLHRLRPRALRDLVFYCCCALRLRQMHIRADIVHVHGDWSAFLCGRLITAAVGAHIGIASAHDHLREGAFWDFVYRHVLGCFDLIYSTGQRESRRLATLLRRETPWITSGLHLVFQQAALDMVTAAQDRECDVITVATLSRRKRLELVISIAALLPHRHFKIVGDGPERAHLIDLAQRQSAHNVQFCGRLAVADVQRCYLSANLFLLTSNTEGTPTVILEAMACGLPIVTSASNDFSGLLEEDITGYVLKEPDANVYVTRIEQLLNDPARLARIRSENRRRAQQYLWPEIAARITAAMQRQLQSDGQICSPK